MQLRKKIIRKLKTFEKDFSVYNNVYVSRSAVLHNYDLLSELSPSGYIIPVLKSNAYGHGIEQIVTILQDREPPYIAVDGYYEGLQIHEVSNQKVLIMGSVQPDNYRRVKTKNFAYVVQDIDTIEAMGMLNKTFVLHIELETGMNRYGVRPDQLNNFLFHVKKYANLKVEGVMTHLADADNPQGQAFTNMQTKKFDQGIEIIRNAGFSPKYLHIAQSAGCTKTSSKYANTIRTGIALYGISPLTSDDKDADKLAGLRPTLSLTSTVTKIIDIDEGETVSYNRQFVAKRKSKIGVLPIGYYEGVPRDLSCTGQVKFENTYLPIAGRVCMNHTMIDVTGSKIKVGDIVTIISNNSSDKLSVRNLCNNHGLFSYSLLTSLNENIRRTVVD
jgi:alanine racemase